MKFTLVALIATFCLLAVNADAGLRSSLPSQDDIDFQFNPTDLAEDEIEDLSVAGNIFKGMFWTLKASLRTLKGVHCSVMGVLDIKAAAEKFIDDVNSCGGVVSKQVQSVITACKNVINTANAIITLNDDACKNGNYNENTDGKKKTPFFSCFLKMLRKMSTLKKQIEKVLSLIKKVPDAGTGAEVCVKNGLNELQSVFTQFPSMVKSCSKLTS